MAAKPKCRLCTIRPLKTEAELASQTCVECTRRMGLEAMPPPRRPPIACARCGGFRFIRAVERHVVAEAVFGAARDVNHSLAVAGATWELDRSGQLYGGAVIPDCKPAIREPRGRMSRYICAACGLTETYCDDPATIPIGPEYMTDVVDYTAMQR
jgi:hypothetical protein